MKELVKRKQLRIKNYDYSQIGAYFVTICTKEKKKLFWNTPYKRQNNNNFLFDDDIYSLSEYGKIVDETITNVSCVYKNTVIVDKYVIMPNHAHLILFLSNGEIGNDGRPMVAPTISRIMQQLKGIVTKQIGFSIWQKGFFEHIIRSEMSYWAIWKYIDDNPIKWETDEYFL